MAVSRLGFTGPMAAYGTFSPKAESTVTAQSPRASRYRGGHRVNYVHRVWWLVLLLLGEMR